MLPRQTSRTFITASLAPGTRSEPKITSQEFLNSFLDYGCWLRPIAARAHVRTFETSNSSELERLAALGALYQLLGAVVEDAFTTFVAWSLWASDKNRSLPDIVGRLSLRFKPAKAPSDAYVEEVVRKLDGGGKRLDVHPREYLSLLLRLDDDELPRAIGIPWNRHPSTKLVPNRERHQWDQLPHLVREVIRPLVEPKGELLTACYNKIKHGPQLVVDDMGRAAAARGHGSEQAMSFAGTRSIRLLLHGGRTQETPDEFAVGVRVAPFLIPDVANVRRLYFQQLVHTTNALCGLGTWLYNTTFVDARRPFAHQEASVQRILEEQRVHLHQTFSPAQPVGTLWS